MSASSIGPIGMPNASAASSTTSGAIPSSTQRIAVIRYGASSRLTRKPGALRTGSGSLSIWRTNAAAFATSSGGVVAPRTISTSIMRATGLKKWMPTRRDGSFSAAPISSSGMEDVLVASTASGRARFSSAAKSVRFASRFSKIASMITSARRTPSPATSGISRSRASRMRRGSLSRSLKSFAARAIAGARRAASWSCSVTVMPRNAHHDAMSPPMVPAPITCTCATREAPSFPSDFRRSCNRNTRMRFVAVELRSSAGTEAGSAEGTASGLPSYFAHISRMAYGAG